MFLELFYKWVFPIVYFRKKLLMADFFRDLSESKIMLSFKFNFIKSYETEIEPERDDQALVQDIQSELKRGDVEKLRHLINSSRKVKLRNVDNTTTILQTAMRTYRYDIVKWMLTQQKLIIIYDNGLYKRYRFLAVNAKHIEIVQTLLQLGYSIAMHDTSDRAPLHHAIQQSPEIAHWLIKHGADINGQDSAGNTPLHLAVECNSMECICMLLYYNVDTEIKNSSGVTPFMMSFLDPKKTAIQKLLLKYVTNFNVSYAGERNELFDSLKEMNPQVHELVRKDEDINLLQLALYYENMFLYQSVYQHFNMEFLYPREYPFLIEFVAVCNFPKNEWLKCLYQLLHSRFAYELVNDATEQERMHTDSLFVHLSKAFTRKAVEKEDRVTIINILLNLEAKACIGDAVSVYTTYGYEEEFELFLTYPVFHTKNRMDTSFNVVPDLALNYEAFTTNLMTYKLIMYCDSCLKRGTNFQNVLDGASYFTLQRYFFRVFFGCIPEDILTAIQRMPYIPSLTEMCRNKVIADTVLKFPGKSAVFYHKYFKELPIPIMIKNILRLKMPIYRPFILPEPLELFIDDDYP